MYVDTITFYVRDIDTKINFLSTSLNPNLKIYMVTMFSRACISQTRTGAASEYSKTHVEVILLKDASKDIPGPAAFSFSCLAPGGRLSSLAAGLGGWGGAAALSIPCESHRTSGVRAPV